MGWASLRIVMMTMIMQRSKSLQVSYRWLLWDKAKAKVEAVRCRVDRCGLKGHRKVDRVNVKVAKASVKVDRVRGKVDRVRDKVDRVGGDHRDREDGVRLKGSSRCQ
jgi:hypothetical protein